MGGDSEAPIFDGTQCDRRRSPPQQRTTARRTDRDDGGDDEKQRFRGILAEVQQLVSSQATWKERKQLEQKKVAALGGKPAKSFKMPMAMGLNVKRKRERLEAERVQQDMLLGIFPSAKRKKRFRENDQDKGLMLSEGKFKGGVLYVKRPESKAADMGEQGRGRSRDATFEGRRKGGSKSTKGKSKKGKGRKKGGKSKR